MISLNVKRCKLLFCLLYSIINSDISRRLIVLTLKHRILPEQLSSFLQPVSDNPSLKTCCKSTSRFVITAEYINSSGMSSAVSFQSWGECNFRKYLSKESDGINMNLLYVRDRDFECANYYTRLDCM